MNGMQPGSVTAMLNSLAQGNEGVRDKLYRIVYQELRKLAAGQLEKERRGAQVQLSSLVHEAYIALVRYERVPWQARAQFYSLAAHVMRNLLVTWARARLAKKRNRKQVELRETHAVDFREPGDIDFSDPSEILALDKALRKLEQEDPRKVRVVEFRLLAGLTAEQTAQALGITKPTVDRDLRYAKAFLFDAMRPAVGEAQKGGSDGRA